MLENFAIIMKGMAPVMKEKLKKVKISPVAIILSGVILIYFIYICYLNLSLTPSFYCTDMYSDILYSVRAWESKSIFPEGWVFGNQLYVIATPVLASLIYGIIGQPALSMAVATIIMTLGIFASFLWMLRPVFPRIEERLLGLLFLIALTAYCGDAIYTVRGWQLFFTMCSYYACYVITAFTCFGCFLRRHDKLTKPRIAILIISILLSFACGMQSLRQTAVMILPMLAVEGIMQLRSLIKEKRIEWQPLIITASLSAANLLGLLVARLVNIPKNEIFSSAELLEKTDIPASVNTALTNIAGLLTDKDHRGILFLMVVTVTVVSLIQAKRLKDKSPDGWGTLISLFGISILGILLIDIYTKMYIRSIYYFMLFPLIAILPIYAYRRWRFGKIITVLLLTMIIIGSYKTAVLPAAKTASQADTNLSYEISDMLLDKGYTTIYSGWNQCEDIAIASGGEISAGFWDSPKDVFNPVMYLCDPTVYEVESERCVYYLRSDNRNIALQKAGELGVTMTLVAEYPEWGIWLYEASENLMQMNIKQP